MKKNQKVKALAVLTVLLVAVFVTACGGNKKSDKEDVIRVKVGVVGESDVMWEPVIEELKKDGILVEIVSFTDYGTPNKALNDGDTDLNAFQHYAYLDKEVETCGYKITAIGDTYISAMNIYSSNVEDVSEIIQGAKIGVPNDATNEGRALKVLEAAKLIKIDPAAGDSPEIKDIVENSLNIEFVEVDAGNLYALLPDVTAAVINCNYALDYGLSPGTDGIFQDNVTFYTGKSYVNLIASRIADVDNETYKKVVKAYQSEAVKKVFAEHFKGAYIAAWID